MHNDVATWGLVLQLVALFLTLPLAIIGTLLAPKVEDWMAATSKRSLATRIEYLEAQIAEMEKEPPLTEPEEQITKFLEQTIFSLGYLMAILVMLVYQSTQIPEVVPPLVET
jgi:hypothetical protein